MKPVLLIGPRENKKDPTKTGGVVVLFADLLGQFTKRNISNIVIDTNKSNYYHPIMALFCIWVQVLFILPRVQHVSLHGTLNDYKYIAPFVVFFSKLSGKRVSLRKFGGDFKTDYLSSPFVVRKGIAYALKNADSNFFETLYLVDYFSQFNTNTFWFPNVRIKSPLRPKTPFQHRFIFLGTMTREKGVMELLEASNKTEANISIDLYGPLADDMKTFDFTPYKARYQGPILHSRVIETLMKYDILVLPSHREGYPGVIIEALSVGMPVIATNVGGIKEMIDENCSIIIEPKSTDSIIKSINQIDEKKYEYFSQNSLKAFEKFDSDVQTGKFIQIILR